MANNGPDNRNSKIAAWVGTSAIIGAQGKLIKKYGGPAAKGFFTGFGSLVNPKNVKALRAAPLPIKIATGVMLAAGWAAKRPLDGIKSSYEVARQKVNDYWK